MNPLLMGGIVDAVGKVVDDLTTSDKERLDAEIELKKIGLQAYQTDASLVSGQQEINRVEAQSDDRFKSGWRPGVGWIYVLALAYQFIAYPFLTWAWAFAQAKGYLPTSAPPPPIIDIDALYALLTALLGISGMRSFEKVKRAA